MLLPYTRDLLAVNLGAPSESHSSQPLGSQSSALDDAPPRTADRSQSSPVVAHAGVFWSRRPQAKVLTSEMEIKHSREARNESVCGGGSNASETKRRVKGNMKERLGETRARRGKSERLLLQLGDEERFLVLLVDGNWVSEYAREMEMRLTLNCSSAKG